MYLKYIFYILKLKCFIWIENNRVLNEVFDTEIEKVISKSILDT